MSIVVQMETSYGRPIVGESLFSPETNSSLAASRKRRFVGFYDNYANGPLGLSSFVTHNDPVVQQLAGWISARGGGIAPCTNNKDAIKFMGLLYGYISESHIAYQTPPGGISGGKHYQHVKYARDVLHNRAGT